MSLQADDATRVLEAPGHGLTSENPDSNKHTDNNPPGHEESQRLVLKWRQGPT